MGRAITQLPPELATIRRGLVHEIPFVYTDDLGRFLSISGHSLVAELRSDRALDSTLLGTYTVTQTNSAYGQGKATLDGTATGALLTGQGWVTVRVTGASTGGIAKVIIDASVSIV